MANVGGALLVCPTNFFLFAFGKGGVVGLGLRARVCFCDEQFRVAGWS